MCGHQIPADVESCESCSVSTNRSQERDGPEGSHLVKFASLSKRLKVALLLVLIVGTSLLAASFAFQPRSTTPEYTANLNSQADQLNSQLAKLQSDATSLRTQINRPKDYCMSWASSIRDALGEVARQHRMSDLRQGIQNVSVVWTRHILS
jgi:outer membrane murein-binding lipoprotein Lpp